MKRFPVTALGALRGAAVGLLLLALTTVSTARAEGPKQLRVASKAFTESVIVAELVTQLVRSAGMPAEHRSALGGTRLVWDALVNGSIDVYPEYTGTLLDEILAAPAAGVSAQGGHGPDTRAWLEQALSERGIAMSAPLGFNNTYALGFTAERARALGVSRISDLRPQPSLRFGFSNEFLSRQDGWPALRQRYSLPQRDVRGLDHDLAYGALRGGAIDATDLYTTDAEIRRYDLKVLEDDLGFFRRYDAVLLYRRDIEGRLGGLVPKTLARLAGHIDAAQMTSMNARAKLDGVPEARVASDFLKRTFGIDGRGRENTEVRQILARLSEHLLLVAASLLAAIAVAIPLGVLSARQRALGQIVLAAVGVIQTLPSLALLVFMIPFFGIGGWPALVALFLYSLLPIVRNTHAGLRGIPGPLLESAQALGLSTAARLRLIELPLASPSILAGIKSAAVINVGTATLGALVGAGGLGQLIFTGIRLDSSRLILEGAIPASLLALAVQGGFELVERRVVPRGLRLTLVD